MKIYHKIVQSKKIQQFMNNSVLMNWNDLNKSILVLLLGGAAHITWICWYLYFSQHPSFEHWFNHDYGVFHLARMIVFCIICFALIIPIWFWGEKPYIAKYFPYISVIFFGMSFVYGGYTVGITSPVAIAAYISLITVGMVLYKRTVMYVVFIPITIYLVAAIILTLNGQMTYAPIYTLEYNQKVLHRNEFWVYSQMYFYIPIFFCSLVLFEVLLIQWRNREKKIRDISQIDPLTGIYNRRKIGQNLTEIQNEHRDVTIILMDLDHFKKINDSYGHDVGDDVLKQVALTLSKNVRDEDVVGRFGGEEFILVLQNKSIQQALDIAERCRKEIESTRIKVNDKEFIQISASFGITVGNHYQTKQQILKQADEALYLAKKSGRNQVKQFEECASYLKDSQI